MALTVSQVAKLANITVRTLHHYDEVGLVRPSGRSEAGYRLYEQADLERLQQVLFFKELGFPLETIRRVMTEPDFDVKSALAMQRELLTQRAAHLQSLLRAVDAALAAQEKGTAMNKKEMFEVFGDFDPARYEEEVKERWGETDAYKASARRTKKYTKEDWKRFKTESESLLKQVIDGMVEGRVSADSATVALAEEARLQIDRWFYPCSHAMHRALAEMYIADERFTATYENMHVGLAKYFHDAIVANAERHGA